MPARPVAFEPAPPATVASFARLTGVDLEFVPVVRTPAATEEYGSTWVEPTEPQEPVSIVRDPEAIRARLAAHAAGVRRGRDDINHPAEAATEAGPA